MSIIIPRMKMPKDEKALHLDIYSDGIVLMWQMGDEGKVVGTAIELPPHGRMIDADAFNRNIANAGYKYDPFMAAGVIAFVNDAPTIIPADPEGGETNG